MRTRISFILGGAACCSAATAQELKPNIVWVMMEDVAADYLSIYNKKGGAHTPNAEMLIKDGVQFNNAYSNAPVSSAARSTLTSGCYANRTAIGFHRSMQSVNLPSDVKSVSAYLRSAGYYTTNSKKQDYNYVLEDDVWDNGSASTTAWRDRPTPTTPFFHTITFARCHESCLHFKAASVDKVPTRYNPNNVKVAPFHPNTKLMRYTYATFYDRINDVDAQMGEVVNELRKDSLLNNTFIFFFGDNGGALPATKGYTGEQGLRVPLVVYIPPQWRDKLDLPIGSSVDGFVSFVDFAPTILNLAGIEIPKPLDGTPFMGTDIKYSELNSRDKVYGYGDRYDELYAFTRTLRKGNMKYVRNFQSYNPKSLHAFYRYRMAAFTEWRELYKEGVLTDVQSRFFEKQAPQELYDLSIDPYETNNLAFDLSYNTELKKMSAMLQDQMVEILDIGYFPEHEWIDGIKEDNSPTRFTSENSSRIKDIAAVTELAITDFDKSKGKIAKALISKDCIIRYWALISCLEHGEDAASLKEQVSKLEDDDNGYIRSKSLLFAAINDKQNINTENIGSKVKEAYKMATSDGERLMILNDIVYLNDVLKCDIDMNDITYIKKQNKGILHRLDYLNR